MGICLGFKKFFGHKSIEMAKEYVDIYAEDLQDNFSDYNILDRFSGTGKKIQMQSERPR